MKTMKKIVAILAVALMLCSILPLSVFAADNVADFNTVTSTSTSYSTATTTNGWKAVNSAVLSGAASGNSNPKFTFIDTNTATRAFCMNGKKSAVGQITSPTLSGGISELTLNYGLPFSDTKLSFTITITGADGTTATKTVNPSSVTKLTKYELDWVLDTPITGDFTIVIKNNCPSNSTSNKDRTAIWNVAWVSAADEGGCEHDWKLISTTDADCDTEGEEYYECAACGESKTETIDALGHSYGDAVETVAPDCVNAGEQESVCSACGDVKTETVKALGHDWVDGFCDVCGEEKPLEATITFSDDKAQRTEYSTESQKWENDGLVLINNKAGSTNNVGDFTNPAGRFYKSSEIIISYEGMTSLVIDAPDSTNYAWTDTLNNAGLTYEADGGVYTITFAEPTDSITLTAANQVRAYSITAYGQKACEHEYDNDFDVDCNVCGDVRDVVNPIFYVGMSASEDVSGLAVKYDVAVEGLAVKAGTFVQADYTNATYNGYKLLEFGVVASNGKSEITIKGDRMYDLEDGNASFAFRIVNIPESGYETEITFTPYYVVEIDGVATTITGEAATGTYAEYIG